MLDRCAQWAGDGLHPIDAPHPKDGLGDLFDHEHVRGGAQVVIGLEHQQFGVHAGLGEVAVRDAHGKVGGHIGGGELLVVVLRHIGQQGDEADDGDHGGDEDDRNGPANHGGTDLAPTRRRDLMLGVEQTELRRHRQDRRRQRQCCGDDHQNRDRAGQTHGLEVGQRGHGEAQAGTDDGQSGTQDDMRYAAVGDIERVFSIEAFRSLLVISPE